MTRVSFVVSPWALQSGKVVAALKEVFGAKIGRYANCSKPLTIDCSPERFCRFLIARNEFGAANSFKDLKLRIVEPEPTPTKLVFD